VFIAFVRGGRGRLRAPEGWADDMLVAPGDLILVR
jgi:hypothetical protein